MEYFRVINNSPNFINNELLTSRELERLAEKREPRPASGNLEKVQISKRRVYWFFGARFEIDNPHRIDYRVSERSAEVRG